MWGSLFSIFSPGVITALTVILVLVISFWPVKTDEEPKPEPQPRPIPQPEPKAPASLLQRWIEIREQFKRHGFDARTRYQKDEDLFRTILLLSEGDQYTDKTHIARMFKLYEKLLFELTHRDPNVIGRSQDKIDQTLGEFSTMLIEHQTEYEKVDNMHFTASLNALKNFVKLRR